MKYGDTLRQHSVPEWAYYNVDYDAVKGLIKECTSAGKGKVLDIPGQSQDASAGSEKSLFGVLVAEHDRIGLFVKSKSNEIGVRLGNIERTLKKLQTRNVSLSAESPRPYVLQRYGKLEQEAILVGEEIRSLSRFITAQRTAFRKLLKKYKKWSHNTDFDDRFRSEVLNRPTSFTRISMDETFDRWTEILQSIRQTNASRQSLSTATRSRVAAGKKPRRETTQAPIETSTAIATRFEDALNPASDINYDTAFSELPQGDVGSRAAYWVHPEQLIELQVLLLQHLRLYVAKPMLGTPSTSLSESPVTTRRSSLSQNKDGFLERESDTGIIVMDRLEDFAKRQSNVTVSEAENFHSSASLRPKAAALWTSTMDDATFMIRRQTNDKQSRISRLRKKHLGAFLDADRDFKPWQVPSTPIDGMSSYQPLDNMSPDEGREFLEKHDEIEPLVAAFSKRTRFVGLGNGVASGQWASLDAQICFNKVNRKDLAGKDWISNISRDAKEFPHAVLWVRQEGKCTNDIIDILDKSHLTERVRGFTLTGHAVWECCKPRGMAPPLWLPAISRDIRKVPENVNLGRGTSSNRNSLSVEVQQPQGSRGSSSSDNNNSGYSTGAIQAESSATSVPTTPLEPVAFNLGNKSNGNGKANGKQVAYDDTADERPSRKKRKEEVRYWNEFDFPESDDEHGAYYIYIDPDQEDKWPGQDFFAGMFQSVRSIFSRGKQELPDEERPLTSAYDEDDPSSSPTDSDTDAPSKILFVDRKKRNTNGHYGTMNSERPNTDLSQLFLPPVDTIPTASTSSRLLICMLSMMASVVLCIVGGTLAATGRHKQQGEVAAGILLGVIASLFFALVGLVSVLTARDSIGLLRWVVVGFAFCAICLADGVLLGWVIV